SAANGMTDALVHRIAAAQALDGDWGVWAAGPPIEYSEIRANALSVRALTLYGTPGRRAEFDARVARASKWLETAPAKTSEERNMRLLGLVWTQAKPDAIRNAVDAIVAQQRDDGGWAP